MTSALIIERRRRRGAFGLDERRRPDPLRIAGDIRAYLRERLPEILTFAAAPDSSADGAVLLLVRPGGAAAVLAVPAAAGEDEPASLRALHDRLARARVPGATVETLDEARAALRRFGLEPSPCPSVASLASCPVKPSR